MSTSRPGLFRQAFNTWERTTSAYMEGLVRNPVFLTTSGHWMNWLLTARKIADTGIDGLMATIGLASRRDQEQALHLLHKIEGRLEDLEQRLNEHPRAQRSNNPKGAKP
jgi:hypothetical protein